MLLASLRVKPGPAEHAQKRSQEEARHEILQLGELFVIRWRAGPDAASARQVAAAIREAFQRMGKLDILVVIPGAAELPDREARAAFTQETAGIDDVCRSVHFVILGEGLLITLHQALLRTLATLLAPKAVAIRFHRTVEAALAGISGLTGQPPDRLLAKARQLGLVS